MRERHSSTDLLRFTASFFVVLLHAAAQEMGGLSGTESGAWLPCLYNAVSRFSVPIFVMISGRYFLASPCSISRSTKKALQMLRLLLSWSGLYLAVDLIRGWRPDSVSAALARWLTEPVHLWYFYAAAALYLFAPILSVFTVNASRQQLIYALFLTGLFGSVVTTALRAERFPLLAELIEKSKVPYAMGFLFCFLLGHYLTRFPPQKRCRLLLYAAGAAGTLFTFAGTLFLSRSNGGWTEFLFSFYAPNVILTAAAVFTAANHVSLSASVQPFLSALADASGGVYGLHILILSLLPSVIPGILLRTLAAYVASCTAVLIVKRALRLVKR